MEPRTFNNILMLPLILVFQAGSSFNYDNSNYLRSLFVKEQAHHFTGKDTQQAVQGLHLALAGTQQLRVTWMIPAAWGSGPFGPVCWYGSTDAKRFKAKGVPYTYHAGMFSHTLNTAVLDLSQIPCQASLSSAIQCARVISYSCGDPKYGFSDVYHTHFYSDSLVPAKPGPQFAVVGDMAVPHGLKTIDSIAARMAADRGFGHNNSSFQADGVELLLHVGDITYADFYNSTTQNNSWVWVDYMNSMQKVAAHLPYMTAPGNHEAEFDFAAYLNWLPMPSNASGSGSPFWFSFDYLGVHVLMFSTEHDFSPLSKQHQWIQKDLEQANKNRAQVPWIVVLGHRPLYCSSIAGAERCHEEAAHYRLCLEHLFLHARVDVVIAGHIHHYERSFPVYQGKVTQKDYHNPQAPVYIVNGGAGNPELNDPTFEPNVDWRAWYNITLKTGFLLMTPSRSQLVFDYAFSDSNDVIDSFTITKECRHFC